jgi:hypothetical protein
MSGAIPSLPNTPPWRGVQLKHRDNFTFTFDISPFEPFTAMYKWIFYGCLTWAWNMDSHTEGEHNMGARSELNSVFGLEKVNRWNPIRTSAIQSGSRPMRFLGFSNHEKGAPMQEILKLSTVCSTFSRRWWSVVSSESLAKRGTSKKRPSPHLHEVPTRSNKVSPRTLQTALVGYICCRRSNQ